MSIKRATSNAAPNANQLAIKIKIVQASPKVGDLKYNFDLVVRYYQKALAENLTICLFPELVTCGYIPYDLLLIPSFIADIHKQITLLLPLIKDTVLLLPTPLCEDNVLYNAVLAIQNGQIIGKTYKKHLPNYGVFCEKRYFTDGNSNLIKFKDKDGRKLNIGVPICEDILFPDVCLDLKDKGAQVLLVPNASPYEMNKFDKRLAWVENRFKETSLPIIYCNMVAAEDGIIFDGRSFAYDIEGLNPLLPIFKETDINIEIIDNIIKPNTSSISITTHDESLDEVYGAMVFGLREYVLNNGFNAVIIGLSGGIDSAVVATIAVDALGAEKVMAVMMPTKFTTMQSLMDAEEIAKLLKINYQVIPIDHLVQEAADNISDISEIAMQNLQSRIRGVILMTLANTKNRLLINTGNKSEIATGYTTIYGDMCGAFSPIGDLYKTQIYEIAKYRNSNIPQSVDIFAPYYPVLGDNILTKAPSAELAFNQKDSDNLPDYEILDQILELHIEQNMSYAEIVNLGFSENIVKKIIKLVKFAEYKRQQAPLNIKLSSCSFSKDRKYPITHNYQG